MSIPFASATASSSRRWYIEAAFVHGSSAPSEIERVGSGTISSGSITRWNPSPWQRGQQPCGELKEKIRGSSSGIEVPQCRQANFSEKTRTSPRLPALGPESTLAPGPSTAPSSPDARSRISTSISPSASCEAASIDSVSRLRRPSFITRRSTTIEISCLNFLSSSIGSSSRRSSPSMTARAYPCPRISSSSFPYSPLRPRTTGARTMNRVSGSSVITRSAICSSDWPAIGSPQLWQCGLPIRAQSRRR